MKFNILFNWKKNPRKFFLHKSICKDQQYQLFSWCCINVNSWIKILCKLHEMKVKLHLKWRMYRRANIRDFQVEKGDGKDFYYQEVLDSHSFYFFCLFFRAPNIGSSLYSSIFSLFTQLDLSPVLSFKKTFFFLNDERFS